MKWTFSGLVLMVAMLAVGCGGDDQPSKNGGESEVTPNGDESGVTPAEKTKPQALAFPTEQATATIAGKILFEGDPPPPKYVPTETIAASKDKFCEKHHEDKPVLVEDLIVSSDGAIRNVLVYVKKFPEDWTHATPADSLLLDQKNCTYVPHVFGVMVGQTVQVTSSDATAHNVHLVARRNRGENFAIAVDEKKDVKFKMREEPGTTYFKCDIHSWMRSWVGVFKHPFFAVTGDDGTFELPKLPPGQYTIGAWHETLGKQEQQITLADGDAITVEFTFQKEG